MAWTKNKKTDDATREFNKVVNLGLKCQRVTATNKSLILSCTLNGAYNKDLERYPESLNITVFASFENSNIEFEEKDDPTAKGVFLEVDGYLYLTTTDYKGNSYTNINVNASRVALVKASKG